MAEYVNNKEFLSALLSYDQIKKDAIARGETEIPNPSDYIVKTIMDIAEHYSYKSNFINYSFREDMVLDGIEGCLNAVRKHFDPTKAKSALGYFTQICHYAFLYRIKKEKKQTTIKNKIIMQMPIEFFELQDHDGDGDYVNTHIQFLQEVLQDSYEPDVKKTSKSEVSIPLEDLFED